MTRKEEELLMRLEDVLLATSQETSAVELDVMKTSRNTPGSKLPMPGARKERGLTKMLVAGTNNKLLVAGIRRPVLSRSRSIF